MRGRQEWSQIFSTKWKDYVVSHRILHHHNSGELKFGLPEGVRWKEYYSKDPFCGVLPLIASAFAREKVTKEKKAATITLQDRFSNHVWTDAKKDFSNG